MMEANLERASESYNLRRYEDGAICKRRKDAKQLNWVAESGEGREGQKKAKRPKKAKE